MCSEVFKIDNAKYYIVNVSVLKLISSIKVNTNKK